jgi:methionyl-tRNA formyltransferase
MGSPEFAVPALQALHADGHEIAAVYCQPPRPARRGQRLTPCAVQMAAEGLGLPVRTPLRLRRDAEAQAAFAALRLEAAVVAAYGQILPQPMLDAPARGCLNIHASLLPRWRGAAPIQAAILAGDERTGVCIMRMEAGLDTGPELLRAETPIAADATAGSLAPVLAALGAELIVRALRTWPDAVPQPELGATYAPKLSRADGRLDWRQPAEALERRVRAFDPWPGTHTILPDGQILKVLAAEPVPDMAGPAGMVLRGLVVACGAGALRVLRVQAPGRPAMAAEAFLRGRPVPVGTVLGGGRSGERSSPSAP